MWDPCAFRQTYLNRQAIKTDHTVKTLQLCGAFCHLGEVAYHLRTCYTVVKLNSATHQNMHIFYHRSEICSLIFSYLYARWTWMANLKKNNNNYTNVCIGLCYNYTPRVFQCIPRNPVQTAHYPRYDVNMHLPTLKLWDQKPVVERYKRTVWAEVWLEWLFLLLLLLLLLWLFHIA